MPDPTTANLGLAVPTRGSDIGTWDVPLNGDMNIIDSKFGVVSTIALSNVPVTLSETQYQSSILRFTGVLTVNVTITLPAVSLMYACENLCTGPWQVILTCGGQVIALPPNECVNVFTDGTNVKFKDLGRIGSYLDYAGSGTPGWVVTCTVPPFLKCDGSTYSSVTYPALFTILGTTTLPDLRGRSRAYLNDGTNRINTFVDGNTIFAAGGVPSVTLDTSTIPSHSHTATVNDPGHNHTWNNSPVCYGGGGNPAGTFGGYQNAFSINSAFTGISVNNLNTGGGAAHNNMPPVQISGITMIRAA